MARKRSTATRRAESEAATARAAAIRAEQERRERRRRSLVVTAVGVAVLTLVLVIGYLVQASRDDTGEAATGPRGAVGYALEVGPATAPATVTIVEDPMCPFCGDFENASRGWLSDYAAAGKVRVRFRVISFLDDTSNGTEYSTRAASALAVVLDSSGPRVAKRFHDLLFENQPPEGSDGLSDSRLTGLAVQAGATRSAVEKGIRGRSFESWVNNATDAGTKLEGYQGTPFVQLDGEPFTDYDSVDELSANLRSAVDAASG
ncbi:MAG TPA: DsbA family protein [Nocardioidaceae bacterium]|nr:DsbA family protein [Nocardioidaceae bacterium]